MSPSRRLPARLLTRALCSVLLLGLLAACDVPDSGAQTGPPVQTQTRAPSAPVREARDPRSGLPFIPAAALPAEGQRTLRLIRAGGPFPYRKDGSPFGNREGILPRRAGGAYREYTVPTPGEEDRGARRIVCRSGTNPGAECYYSADHYASFRRIRP